MVGMEHDGKHKNALLRKHVVQILGRRDSMRFPHLVHFYASGRSTRPPALFVTECRVGLTGVSMDA